jgi:hypothetical protein
MQETCFQAWNAVIGAPAPVHPSIVAFATQDTQEGLVNIVSYCHVLCVLVVALLNFNLHAITVDCPKHQAWWDMTTSTGVSHALATCSNKVRTCLLCCGGFQLK